MKKMVVPQFVADWYEENENSYILGAILDELKKTKDENIVNWRNSCYGRHKNKLDNAEEVITKIHLYGYEVEKEKKYYWRKKKEHMFSFDEQDSSYLNVNKETGDVFFGTKVQTRFFQTLLTETQVRQAVIEEDFNKLERVEVD